MVLTFFEQENTSSLPQSLATAAMTEKRRPTVTSTLILAEWGEGGDQC